MEIKENLKKIRNENKLLQSDIAKVLNVAESTYSHFESGDAIITIKRLNDFCNYFNISIDYIFGNTNIKNYNNVKLSLNTEAFKKRFKEFRKENNLTQKILSKELNIGISVISGYEIGRYIIATQFLYTICKKYNISADYLLGKTDEPKYFEK